MKRHLVTCTAGLCPLRARWRDHVFVDWLRKTLNSEEVRLKACDGVADAKAQIVSLGL